MEMNKYKGHSKLLNLLNIFFKFIGVFLINFYIFDVLYAQSNSGNEEVFLDEFFDLIDGPKFGAGGDGDDKLDEDEDSDEAVASESSDLQQSFNSLPPLNQEFDHETEKNNNALLELESIIKALQSTDQNQNKQPFVDYSIFDPKKDILFEKSQVDFKSLSEALPVSDEELSRLDADFRLNFVFKQSGSADFYVENLRLSIDGLSGYLFTDESGNIYIKNLPENVELTLIVDDASGTFSKTSYQIAKSHLNGSHVEYIDDNNVIISHELQLITNQVYDNWIYQVDKNNQFTNSGTMCGKIINTKFLYNNYGYRIKVKNADQSKLYYLYNEYLLKDDTHHTYQSGKFCIFDIPKHYKSIVIDIHDYADNYLFSAELSNVFNTLPVFSIFYPPG